ncbi:MAG: hypothetical protein GEV05_20585 [Betaproteobacteria bacterium]|nr:hypothetical protein [Betaproteobacteria bacterium]
MRPAAEPATTARKSLSIRHRSRNERMRTLSWLAQMLIRPRDGDRERCTAVGMDDYLSKPFARQQFEAVLRRWLPPSGFEADTIAAATASQGTKSDAALSGSPADGHESEIADEVLDALRAARRLGRPDIVQRIIRLYLYEAPGLMDAIFEAAAAGDSKAMRAAAHSLASSSANVRATRLCALCAQVRSRQRRGTMTSLPPSN